MANPYRFLSLGLLVVVGLGAVGVAAKPSRQAVRSVPSSLPAAYAAPAEVKQRVALREGETLSELLARTTVEAEDARALLRELTSHHDPRTLRPGSDIAIRTSAGDGAVRGVEMRVDPDHVLSVEKNGSGWHSRIQEVPVRVDTAVISGEVGTSLSQALQEGARELPRQEREQIADALADQIFAWKLDFSRDLRRGDRYRVLYERLVRPDGSARSTRVLGAQLGIAGQPYEAFLFTGGGGAGGYYDASGESLRRAFLRAPLEFRRITSAFSTSRFHPILRRARPHHGIDYAAAPGTPIRAVGDGWVTKAGWGGAYGNVVEIRHRRGYSSRYAHMRGFADGIRGGARVKQGDVIGYVGSTGLSTGPHLHFEFRENGRPIDPNSVRELSADPVTGEARARFAREVSAQIALMERASYAAQLVRSRRQGRTGG